MDSWRRSSKCGEISSSLFQSPSPNPLDNRRYHSSLFQHQISHPMSRRNYPWVHSCHHRIGVGACSSGGWGACSCTLVRSRGSAVEAGKAGLCFRFWGIGRLMYPCSHSLTWSSKTAMALGGPALGIFGLGISPSNLHTCCLLPLLCELPSLHKPKQNEMLHLVC